MSSVSEIYGIERVAIAKKVNNEFRDLTDNIVRIGRRIVVPDSSFFIQVLVDKYAKIDFASKDLQFIASGKLLTETAVDPRHFKIARDENTADHIITCYVGRRISYVFIHSEIGLGGFPYNFQQHKALSTIRNPISTASCLESLKFGFAPEICLLYHDVGELRDNAKLLGLVAKRTNLRRMNIRVGRIDLACVSKSERNFLLEEALAICLLTMLPGKIVVLPLNMYIHSFLFVEQTMERMRRFDKAVLTPLLFQKDPFNVFTSDIVGRMTKPRNFISPFTTSRIECQKCYERAGKLSQSLLDKLKNVSFKIGPNYIHDIIDSI